MVLNLNILPYFDDYNEDKNFHRILFKPGVAVQARELTQLQTILQNQIERFGDHVFENGSRVLGGSFDPYDPIPYVRVNITSSIERDSLIGKELTGSVTSLKARVIHAEPDPQISGVSVLYLSYTDLNSQTDIQAFQNETLTYVDNASVTRTLTTTTTNITGFGSVFGITEGVLYVRGFFVKFNAQKIAVDFFNSRASKRVYFKADFVTIDSNADTSLLDPAQGFNNFNAPGADRLRCDLTLVTSDLDVDLRDDSHYLLFEINRGEIVIRNEKTAYNEVAAELAKRTFDESGDYVVRGWNVRSREHLNTGSNGGKYTAEDGGDENKLVIELEKGLAYVKGYEVETVETRPIATDKATEYRFVDEQSSFITSGPYIIVNEMMGTPDPDAYVEVELYDTAENRVTLGTSYDVAPTGTKIGTARIVSYIEESGVYGQAEGEIRLLIDDINIDAGKSFANARAVYTANTFFADIVLDVNGNAVIGNEGFTSKFIYVGNDFVRSVKDSEDNSDVTITFIKQSEGLITTGGLITGIVSLGTNESLIYGTQTLGDLAKEQLILSVTEDAVVTVSGNVSIVSGNTDVVGTNTVFNNLNIGDRLRIDGSLYKIATIESDTALTLETAASSTYSGTFNKEYLKGDLIDLNTFGADGGRRVVTATPSTISVDLNETFSSGTDCKLTYRVKRESVQEIAKNIRAKRYVLIDGSSASDLSLFYLGVSDVFNIRQVRKHSTTFSSVTDGVDVTDSFLLYDNINDSNYNTSYITTATPISNTEHLLIEFDYYEADVTGGGFYFSIDSYPIDDSIESDTTVKTVDLTLTQRNFLDFRPVKDDSATPGTTIGTAPTNPTLSNTFKIPTGGLRQPAPGTNIIFDYSYYIARKDALVVYPNGVFKIVQGRADEIPPDVKLSDSYMLIANIYIPPYPSTSQNFAKILDKLNEPYVQIDKATITRTTMRELDTLKTRIRNLEYYNALTLLEKDTADLIIPDENGLDRFKNGFYVNPFVDHSLSDSRYPGYNIAIDRQNKLIRPAYNVDGFDIVYGSGSNAPKTGALVHLPYTETVLNEQLFATTTRNIELSSYRFIGELNVYPDVDTWVDTTTVDRVIDIGNDLPEGQVITNEWGAWVRTESGIISGENIEIKVFDQFPRPKLKNEKASLLETFTSVGSFYNFLGISTWDVKNFVKRYMPGRVLPSDFDPIDINNPLIQLYLTQRVRYRGANLIVEYGTTITDEETITFDRVGIETTLTTDVVTEELGTFVTDATLIPYIRPQTLKLYGYGLKPNTRYHVFFDGENMNSYTTPVNVTQYFNANTVGVTDNGYQDHDVDLSLAGSEGDNLFSNEFGEVLAYLRLPSGVDRRFTTGEKEIVVTDNPTNDPDATSYAIGKFTSSGLNLQKQKTILSTKNTTSETVILNETRQEIITTEREGVSGSFRIRRRASCAAYSFYIDEPGDVEGVFLSSVDIWLSELHPTLGIWFELREMSNDGNITDKTIPYSVVWMNRNDPRLNISTDGVTNATNVNFDSPIFLYNKTQYAFVIHTEGLNPDSYFWVSRLGETDVVSGNPVTSRGQFGTYYTTNNNRNWDIVPDIDLKVRFNRVSTGASTASPVTGTATLVVEDVEFVQSNSAFASTFFYDGEPIRGSEILNIAIDGANTIAVGDTIQDSVSNTVATVINVDGTDIYTDGFDYIVGANVEIYAQGNTSNIRDTGVISSVDFGMGVVDKITSATKRFDIIHSNGKFFVGSVLRSVLPNRHKSILNGSDITITYTGAASAVPNPFAPTGTITLPVGLPLDSGTIVPTHTIDQLTTFDFAATTFRPGYLNFDGETSVTFSQITTTNTTIGSAEGIYPNAEREFNVVKSILSRSEEVRLLGGEKTFKINASMSTTSDYLMPILDSTVMGSVFTINQLNNDTTDENLAFRGNLESKLITQVIQLTEDNPAEDLIVQLQEYRPNTTDIKVWARVKSSSDTTDIVFKDWFELTANKSAVSSDVNKTNYIDTTYQIPAERLTGDSGAVQYTLSGNLAVISATEMVANTDYVINTVGTTDFTAFGAANNVPGEVFTANSAGTGTGTVSLADDIIYTRFTEFQLKIGMLGSNRAAYPKASKLRAIALQR